MAVPQPYTVPNEFVNNTTITSDSHNENWDYLEIYAEALSDGTYIATDAITTLKIQDSAVTTSKLAAASVTSVKMAANVGLVTPDIGAATGASLNTTGNVVYHITISNKTTDYTLVAGDDGDIVEMDAATNKTISIPLNATVPFAIGTQIIVSRVGLGEVSIAGVSGVTLQAAGSAYRLRAQFSAATCIKRATDTWILIGDTKV